MNWYFWISWYKCISRIHWYKSISTNKYIWLLWYKKYNSELIPLNILIQITYNEKIHKNFTKNTKNTSRSKKNSFDLIEKENTHPSLEYYGTTKMMEEEEVENNNGRRGTMTRLTQKNTNQKKSYLIVRNFESLEIHIKNRNRFEKVTKWRSLIHMYQEQNWTIFFWRRRQWRRQSLPIQMFEIKWLERESFWKSNWFENCNY